MIRMLTSARHLATFLAMAALMLLTACQKDLCYEHKHKGLDDEHGVVHVRFQWNETQNPKAEEMHLVAFNNRLNPVVYPLDGMEGGDIVLYGGTYWFVAYNSDTETVATRGNTYDDFEMCGVSRDLSRYVTNFMAKAQSFTSYVRKDGTRNEEVDVPIDSISYENLSFIWEPERVWVSADSVVTILPAVERDLPMTMRAATYQYTFLINNVANLDRVHSISAILTGLASGYSPSECQPKDFTAAEIFGFQAVDAASIRGTLRVFGHSPEEAAAHGGARAEANILTLYVTMDTGNRYGFVYDVTDDIQNPTTSSINPNTGEIVINIRIDDIPIPDQPISTGLFNIDIDDFETEEWNIYP